MKYTDYVSTELKAAVKWKVLYLIDAAVLKSFKKWSKKHTVMHKEKLFFLNQLRNG